jgi:hypothetical protein
MGINGKYLGEIVDGQKKVSMKRGHSYQSNYRRGMVPMIYLC